MSIEKLILNQLTTNERFARQVTPFIRTEYFQDQSLQTVYGMINAYIGKYNALPSREALLVDLQGETALSEAAYQSSAELIEEITGPLAKEPEHDWLVDKTEKFCQERAIHNAILESIKIIDDKKKPRSIIPELLSSALSVSFNSSVGHSYLEDFAERFKFYHDVEERIPFDIDFLNRVTKGGLPRKTLNLLIAGTNVGKTLAMCHMAAANFAMGKNVLYITLEMAKMRIAERIDANLMNIDMDDLPLVPEDAFAKKVERISKRTTGQLVVEEFPTSSASVVNFRHLLNELKLKRNFIPDIIYIDYLNIAASSRIKLGAAGSGSYNYIKAIAEEFRGFAVEANVPIVTATQLNREGMGSSDPDMTSTSECIWVDERVELLDGRTKRIGEVKIGDQITANDAFKTVYKVHHPKLKECVKITLKSGRTIVVSKDHVFPSRDQAGNIKRLSVNEGLSVGYLLSSK